MRCTPMYEVCPCTSLAPLPTFTDATWDRTSRSKIAGSKSRLMIVVAGGCFGFNLKADTPSLMSLQSDWLWCFQWCRGEGCEKLIGDEEFQIKCTTPAKLIGDEDYAKLLFKIYIQWMFCCRTVFGFIISIISNKTLVQIEISSWQVGFILVK